jgi:predicted O-methyltransferase YrrM
VLRALKRLLRPGGVIAFANIYVTPSLAAAWRQRARRSGPRAVASRSEQALLQAFAGFVDIEQFDLTVEFAITARSWLAYCGYNAAELAMLEPPGAF